ncbi:hypothetical protein G6F47_006203 [Rhizopus delemar]|nr:hypothetical protein G6F54_004497 [Rhizopus delemar]KAG1506251.1 hypothetical protein G6F53_009825 [Rhizopus delemar]KAG1598674.1 hypothetical protein G6F47_006203 [Rhizopus delemar]
MSNTPNQSDQTIITLILAAVNSERADSSNRHSFLWKSEYRLSGVDMTDISYNEKQHVHTKYNREWSKTIPMVATIVQAVGGTTTRTGQSFALHTECCSKPSFTPHRLISKTVGKAGLKLDSKTLLTDDHYSNIIPVLPIGIVREAEELWNANKVPPNSIYKKYLQRVTHPTFARFATKSESEVIERSASIAFEASLQLQDKWITYYNNVITAERPNIQTASRKKDDESYVEEENIEKEDENIENEGEDIENEDEKNYLNYTDKVRSMAIKKLLDPKYTIDSMNIPEKEHNVRHILYKKAHSIIQQESIDILSTELLKLSLSNILNFTNPNLRDIYESLIPTGEMKNINYIRQQKKDELKFDDDMNKIIDELLDQLEMYTTTSNTNKLHTTIDELKCKEQNKRSSKYQLLSVVEIV